MKVSGLDQMLFWEPAAYVTHSPKVFEQFVFVFRKECERRRCVVIIEHVENDEDKISGELGTDRLISRL